MTISSVIPRSAANAQGESRQYIVQTLPVTQSSAAHKLATTETEVVTPTPSSERVAQAVKQVNDAFTQKGQNLYASIERDKDTGIPVVKVLDKNTNEVISQFPSKEIIAIAEAISQSQEEKGQLIHVSA